MRQLVDERHGRQLSRQQMGLLSSFSENNDTLRMLFDDLWLGDVVHWIGTAPKKKADFIEALIWELDENIRNGKKPEDCKWYLEQIYLKLIDIGMKRVKGEQHSCPNWLSQWSCSKESEYTHSSLRGMRDKFARESGRLCIPNDESNQVTLHWHIADSYERESPLTWVEMCTPTFPFVEDIDVMGSRDWNGSPPDHILFNSRKFWHMRAAILHSLFPSQHQLELVLFTASGWSSEKKQWKASYHAVWRNLIVTKEVAHILRKCTVDRFRNDASELELKLLQEDRINSWENVFDISTIRCGSCRMPFNDKVTVTGSLEGRPMEPEGLWHFHFDQTGNMIRFEKIKNPDDINAMEWIRLGSVRSQAEKSQWQPPKINWWLPSTSASHSGGSSKNWATREQEKQQRDVSTWTEEQRRRRRLWYGTVTEFKKEIDKALSDADGHESTLLEINAKKGRNRWLWSSRRLKGAVEIEGNAQNQTQELELFIRGNQEQQLYLVEFMCQFTYEWKRSLPCTLPSRLKKFAKSNPWRTQSGHSQASHAASSWQRFNYSDGWYPSRL